MFENTEMIRVSQSDYNKMIADAKEVHEYTDDSNKAKTVMKFTDRNNFPTVEEMESHKVINNLHKYLPFLMYYHTQDVFALNPRELQRSKNYINEIISQLVDIVDDKDMKAILEATPGLWNDAEDEQRCEIFAPLIEYYGRNEFESFIKDLGWKKFMSAYGYTQKNVNDGIECPRLRDDLAKIWNSIQEG